MLCARRSISMSTRLSRWALLTGLAFAALRPTIAEAQADVPDAANQLEPSPRLPHPQISWPGAFEYPAGIDAALPIGIREACAIAHEPAGHRELRCACARRHSRSVVDSCAIAAVPCRLPSFDAAVADERKFYATLGSGSMALGIGHRSLTGRSLRRNGRELTHV